MGRDKALLPWHGRTLLEHIVALLNEVSDDVLVTTGAEKRYGDLLDVSIFADEIPHKGPMGGLYTGLRHARYEYSFAVACDMPFLEKTILDLLKRELDDSVKLVVPQVRARRVPTLAIYHRECLSVIELLLAQGRTSLQALIDSVPAKTIPEAQLRAIDPELRSFINVNTLRDWGKLVSS